MEIDQEILKSAKILIVDDEEKNVELAKQVLMVNGYTALRTTTDPREACSIYREFRPDLVLLDLRMPHLDGFQVMEQLKEIEGEFYIPVLVLTAQSDDATCQRALNNGGRDFMGKPFNIYEMLSRVRNMLEVRLLQKQIRDQNRILDKKVKERTKELNETRLSVIQRLGRAAEYRDNETGNHVIRMSRYSALLAATMGKNEPECELLLNAAPMHDIGKIGIPDRILLKPGKLEGEDWEIMKSHVTIGAELLSEDSSELLALARIVTLQHHERWDGSGYPNGLKGEEISFEARVVTVSDVFDALTSERPYKIAWTVDETIKFLEEKKGVFFDPSVVENFRKILPDVLQVKEQFSD